MRCRQATSSSPWPHLKAFDLVQGDLLFDAGESVNWVYLPHSGVVSLVVGLADGQLIETAMVGRDSIVGASSALDGRVWLKPGPGPGRGRCATILDVETRCRLAERSIGFRTTLIRHEQILMAQAQQSAACNASHGVEARLARWLLRTRDLTGGEILELTQEFLAQMLGVRRTSVSLVANTLQNAGFIRYRRGHVRSPIWKGSRRLPANAMRTVKAHSDRLLGNGAK